MIQDVGITLDDFLAQKEASAKLSKAQAAGREHEKQTTKGLESKTDDKKRVTTIHNKLTGSDVYAVTRGEGADLMGFSGGDDEDVGRSAAGGRERRDRGPREPRGGKGRGGRKGKLEVNDDDFPTL